MFASLSRLGKSGGKSRKRSKLESVKPRSVVQIRRLLPRARPPPPGPSGARQRRIKVVGGEGHLGVEGSRNQYGM